MVNSQERKKLSPSFSEGLCWFFVEMQTCPFPAQAKRKRQRAARNPKRAHSMSTRRGRNNPPACGSLISESRKGPASGALRTALFAGLFDGGADIANDGAHKFAVFAFGHHADHRFRTGFADQNPSLVAELFLAGGDSGLHALVV